MSNGKGPRPPSGLGALGDDDLLAELEAWDKTFDALHEEGPSTENDSVTLREDTAIEEDFVDQQTRDRSKRKTRPGEAVDEDRQTLDRGLPADDDSLTHDRALDAPLETDFSDLGAAGRPESLGDMLGIGTPNFSEAGADDAATRVSLGAAPLGDPFEEEEVFTSASRPLPIPAPTGHDPDVDDLPAAPPRPRDRRVSPITGPQDFDAPTKITSLDESLVAESRRDSRTKQAVPTPMAPTTTRSSPAVVRRERPTAPDNRFTPAGGIRAVTDAATRVTDLAELEAQAQASAAQFFAELDVAPEIQLEVDESAYDEVAVDSSLDGATTGIDPAPLQPAPPIVPADAPRRVGAHVLRRGAAPTRPPPSLEPDPESRVIELEAEDDDVPPTPVPPGGEDDFSEVAAAVGAADDNALARLLDQPLARSKGGTGPQQRLPRTTPPPPPGARRPSKELPVLVEPSDDDRLKTLELPPRESDVPRPTTDVVSARVRIPPSVPPIGGDAKISPSTLTGVGARVKTPTSVPPIGSQTASTTLVHMVPPIPVVGSGPIAVTPAYDEPEAALDLDALALPEQVDIDDRDPGEDAAAQLLIYERELDTTDDSSAAAALRVESGRLCERVGDTERARVHYEAALIADPRSTAALRGLRRLARAAGDIGEATRHLDAELAIAGGRERRPLALHRIDLLMATGEQDLARVAVGELLDEAPADVRGLLANLELAFLDGRADEFGESLARLADAISDPGLRAVAHVARGHLGERLAATSERGKLQTDAAEGARAAFAAAIAADRDCESGALGLARVAAARGDRAGAAAALAELAVRAVDSSPATAAALGLRAATLAGDPAAKKAAITTALMAQPTSPVIASYAAEISASHGGAAATAKPEPAGDSPLSRAAWTAYRALAGTEARPGVRGYAAAMAAEHAPSTAEALPLWQMALAADADDDYAAAQLRACHVGNDDIAAALDFDRQLVDGDPQRHRVVVRAAYGLAARGDVDGALALLDRAEKLAGQRGGDDAKLPPPSLSVVDARADILAAAGRWEDRAQLLARVAKTTTEDRGLATIRAARAWDDAVAALTSASTGDSGLDTTTRTTLAALAAWNDVLDEDSGDSEAHSSAVLHAERIGDRRVVFDVLGRAQAAERSERALGIALRRVRALIAGEADEADLDSAEDVLRDAADIPGGASDPRRLAAIVGLAARTGHLVEAATALEDYAAARAEAGARSEAAALRYRSAQLWLALDAARATQVLGPVVDDFPGLIAAQDLLGAARRKSGEAIFAPAQPRKDSEAGKDAFARLIREAELSAERGDAAAATVMLGRALELRPNDPLASEPLIRLARTAGQPGPASAVAIGALRAAEALADDGARADAYEQLARIDIELRSDHASALLSWESAIDADPERYAVIRALSRAYLDAERWSDLAKLRELEYALVEPGDAVALALDRALLLERHGATDDDLRAAFRKVIELDARNRLGLFHLEMLVRRQGSSAELAELEERIADWFDNDDDACAAFLTRAGETLTDLGELDAAIDRFKRAATRVPGHVPALQGWRAAALKGELWIDVAEAATREADVVSDNASRAALHHLAGVALMDRALIGERALAALRRAMAADQRHHDAFLRMRILLEEDANHDDLATLLSQRLDVETDPRHRVELHRAVAELHRNFLDDRDTAKRHYRAILESDPNDLKAIAAVSDICFEQGQWAEAAEALMNRAKLESEPGVLKNLFFRLGLIYADRIPDAPVAIKAFQRVLSYAPDDEAALDRLADLAMATEEWKMALGACERLTKSETDPERRVRHLHRVAKIFGDGMGDRKRAERALNLALDGAPASDAALSKLVEFYQSAGDVTSTRVHLNRVAGAMRARIANDPGDGVAARVLSRAMMARYATGVYGSRAIARAGAELAVMLGAGDDAERQLASEAVGRPDLTVLLKPESDDLLFPRSVPPELRQLFGLLGDRVAKHVGVDLRPYGATRGDRQRAKDSPIAAIGQDVAAGLGMGEIDVYISTRQPWVMAAEPTSPVSLVIGAELARGEIADVRFAAGGALKMAHSAMAIPFRLPEDELGAFVVGLVRLFQPDFPARGLDNDVVVGQLQKLKRLIPSGLMNELRPYALALDGQTFDHHVLSAGVRAGAFRAGLVASQSLTASLRVLCGRVGRPGEPTAVLGDPEVRELLAFAFGEDHAQLSGA